MYYVPLTDQVQKEFDLFIENYFLEKKCKLLNNNDVTNNSVKEECAGIYYKTDELTHHLNIF